MSRDVTPVTCPIEGCDFEDPIRSVAAHVSRSEAPGHSWDRLGYDGARSFVRAETGTDRIAAEAGGAAPGREDPAGAADAGTESDATGASGGSSGGEGTDGGGRTDDDGSTAGAGGDAGTGGVADASEGALDLAFVREAAAVEALLERYDDGDLSELDPFRLANLYVLLATVVDDADDARVAVRDELLATVQDDRTIETDVGGVSRQTADRRRLRDHETVRQRLEAAGVDPVEGMDFDRRRVEEVVADADIDAEEVFESEERASVRRTGVDEAAVRELVASLEDGPDGGTDAASEPTR